jgi:uncharacterized membrane protein
MARLWKLAVYLGVIGASVALAAPAAADRLEVPSDAPLWMRVGADVLLYSHIGGGFLAMLTGAIAVLARKGGPLHRGAGKVFVGSMLVMAAIGGAIAPFLNDRISTVAGFMTVYLVATGWLTARRGGGVNWFEKAGLVIALEQIPITRAHILRP